MQAVMRRQQALGAGADTEADSDDPDTVSPDDGTEVEGSGAALQALPPDTMVVSRGGNMNVLSVTRGIGFDHYAGVAVDIEAAEASGKDYLMLSRNGEDVALLLDSEGLEVLAKVRQGGESQGCQNSDWGFCDVKLPGVVFCMKVVACMSHYAFCGISSSTDNDDTGMAPRL